MSSKRHDRLMAFRLPKTSVRTETMWYILAAIFFAVGTYGTLGEYVFHWWDEPWDWAGPLSLALGAVSLVWGASARDVQQLREEVRGSRKEATAGQRHLADGQNRLLEGQERLVSGQERLIAGQEKLIAGQAEQTSLLREVVASFRR